MLTSMSTQSGIDSEDKGSDVDERMRLSKAWCKRVVGYSGMGHA